MDVGADPAYVRKISITWGAISMTGEGTRFSSAPFATNPKPQISAGVVGREGETVVVVDDLLADPGALVDLIADTCAWVPQSGSGNFYPGLRAFAPEGYVACISRALGPEVARAFPDLAQRRAEAAACVSLATLPPESLNVRQRLPHTDAPTPDRIAILHYLCDPSHGGTGFYRHRATGFETIRPERIAIYEQTLQAQVALTPPPLAHVDGDTPLFERIGAVEAKFNRAVIYRSRLLHAGNIPADCALSPDPRRGRLTANTFLAF